MFKKNVGVFIIEIDDDLKSVQQLCNGLKDTSLKLLSSEFFPQLKGQSFGKELT